MTQQSLSLNGKDLEDFTVTRAITNIFSVYQRQYEETTPILYIDQQTIAPLIPTLKIETACIVRQYLYLATRIR